MTEESKALVTTLAQVSRDLQKQKVTPTHELTLSLVNAAQRALEQAKDIDDAKAAHDALRLLEVYFKQQGADRMDANLLVFQRLRTICKLGEMLNAIPKLEGGSVGGRGRPKDSSGPTVQSYSGFLDQRGINRRIAWRWRFMSETLDDEDLRTLQEEADKDPEFEASVNRVFRDLMHRDPPEPEPAPPGTYNVIYADPPWPYNNQIDSWGTTSARYRPMPVEQICTLLTDAQIGVAPNAILFLWVTNPFLKDALAVVDAWGFEYKTNLVWVKTDLQKPGSGFYVRGRHELLFVCTRGSFTPLDDHISPPIGSVIAAPVQDHSRKPAEVYDLIERLYPNCNYLELFARQTRPGWTAWGNEVNGTDR